MTFKQYLESNHIDPNRALQTIVGHGGDILPQRIGMQGYFAEIKEDCLHFVNDVLKVEKDIPFSAFQTAEFGMGSAQLWLQCNVDGSRFVFCLPRKFYKSTAGQLLLDKLDAQLSTQLREDKDYKRFMGKFFWFFAIVSA